MQQFFTPKSIAVIGVSKDKHKVGHVIFKHCAAKFKTYGVNPNKKLVLGHTIYKTVHDIPRVDLAVIAIPAKSVIRTVEELGKKGVKHVIIVSAGFREVGNTRKEHELAKVLTHYKMQSIGPNCLGVFDAHSGLDTLFLPQKKLTRPKPGVISFITQSGAAGSAILDLLAAEGFGFAKFISYGNGTNVSEADVLEYLGRDRQTKVICLYIEGIPNGRRFMEVAKKIRKPIIAIKGGRSEEGNKATLSHTGSLAGTYEVYKGAWRQSNLVVADTLQDVFSVAKLFEKLPKPKGNRVQVITNGGGMGILAIDALHAAGIPLAKMKSESRRYLKNHTPKIVAVANPLDLIGDATNERYATALKVCVTDRNIDVILLIILHQTPLIDEGIIDVVKRYSGRKPIIVISTGGEQTKRMSEKLESFNIPVFTFPETAVRAVKQWLEWYK